MAFLLQSRRAAMMAFAATIGAPALAAPANTPAVADFSTCARPVWPKEALAKKQQGTVTLGFLVSETGAVTDSMVQKSSGLSLLDAAAREGIMKCRFRPSTVDGKPTAAWLHIQYVWTLGPAPASPAGAGFDKAAVAARAEQGDVKAQVALARHYMSTTSAERDPQRGVALLRSAAAAGDTQAMELLATTLLRGTVVPKDLAQSAELYRRAADSGSSNAQYMLAGALLRGEGVPKDEKAGEEWLRKAAALGNPHAQVAMASRLHRRGEFTDEMIALLSDAAASNSPVAQRLLGWCRENGSGITQDYAVAADLYRKAAAAGDNGAKEGLARLYEKGRGVPLDLAVADALKRDAADSALARRNANANANAAGQSPRLE